MAAAVILERVSAGRDISIEKIQSIGAVYNIHPAPPAFSYRGIAGVPPPTEQSTIQQRAQLVETMYTKLTQPGMNALALTGIGGVGKSTLAALLFRYVQAPPSAEKRFFQAPPLWLSIDQAATIADVIGTMYQRLDTPLTVLDNLSPAGQVEALFTLLDTLALPRLIVLDQFENLLDWATGRALPTQPGVGELIDALNSRPWKSSCRLLLTSRPAPKGTREAPATCLHDYAIDGLTQREGLALFRSRGIQAPEAQLQTAVAFCDGHPLSLVLLMALIQLYGISLVDLLAEPTLWIGDIATNLLDAVFRYLTKEQQAILRALSLYRTAVPVAAITPFLPGSSPQQILVSLRSLLVQQLIQPAGNGCYQVHAVVARYMQMHFAEGDRQANQQALWAAHARAAHYYLEQAQATTLPPEQRRGVNDIQGIVEAVWQYTQAAQWQEAYALVEQEHLFYDLPIWGSYILLLDLCQWFLPQPEWQPEPEQTIRIYLYLGKAYSLLGKQQQALDYYQQALTISREVEDCEDEGVMLCSIGSVYYALDKEQQALDYYQQALTILREVGDRKGEGVTLNNIGLIYSALDKEQQALDYHQQALTISREVEDRRSEGIMLSNIGGLYTAMGDKQQALDYYQQALSIHREVGDREGEGATLNKIGSVYHAMGDKQQQALDYYQQALSIRREVDDRRSEGVTLNNIGLIYSAMGDKQQALDYYQQALSIHREVGDRGGEGVVLCNIGGVYDALGHKQQALDYYQQALSIHREVGNRGNEGVALNDIGSVYENMGDKQQALDYYQQALSIQREVEDRRGEGLMLNNIGLIYSALGKHQQALDYYQQALSIHREVGNRQGEGMTLDNIGSVYLDLGNKQQALDYHQQALSIHREVGNRQGEGMTLDNIGSVYLDLGNKQQALDYFLQSLSIHREVGDRQGEGVTQWNIGALALGQLHYDFALAAFLLAKQRFKEVSSPDQDEVEVWIDALRRKIGKKRFAALQARVEPQSQQIFEQALRDRQAQHEEEEENALPPSSAFPD